MAKGTGQKKQLHQLRQEIAHSRDRLARDLSGLRYELDFPLKFRKSVQRHTGTWVSGVAVLGVLFTMLPRRKKVVVKAKAGAKGEEQKKGLLEAGFALGALKLAARMLQPAITSYVTRRMAMSGRGGARR
jgi:hypothetical protein